MILQCEAEVVPKVFQMVRATGAKIEMPTTEGSTVKGYMVAAIIRIDVVPGKGQL